jgi:2'-5' RNA ligase
MNAIVSLLDPEHDRRVRELWGELESAAAVRHIVELIPHPHITYHGAEQYDVARLVPLLEQLARGARPFTVTTVGIGVFTGQLPVLHLAIARNPALAAFHTLLWQSVGPAASDPSHYYDARMWAPHITLAQWDVTPQNLPRLAGVLADRNLEWELPLDNIALVQFNGERYDVTHRFPFGA